jgi:hypothetical protein
MPDNLPGMIILSALFKKPIFLTQMTRNPLFRRRCRLQRTLICRSGFCRNQLAAADKHQGISS